MAEEQAVDAESDAESEYGDDTDALGWYASAAAGDGDGSEEEVADASTAEDPYLAAAEDPYCAAADVDPYGGGDPCGVSDPYGGGDVTDGDVSVAVPQAAMATAEVLPPPVGTSSMASVTQEAPSLPVASATLTPAAVPSVPEQDDTSPELLAARRAARRAAAADADASAPWRQEPARKVQKTQAQVSAQPQPIAASTPVATSAPSQATTQITSVQSLDCPSPVKTVSTMPVSGVPLAPSGGPPPAPPMPELSKDPPLLQESTTPDPDVNMTDATIEPLDAEPEEAGGSDAPEPSFGVEDVLVVADSAVSDEGMTWDEKCIVVRQGQLYIELQRRSPPMTDSILLSFCDWLDAQMPLVVSNFPYVRRSGAYVDLSDNIIGPDGLDKLFRVLRDHRVPCVVMKAYRNRIDDSIVDTFVEYLYTQPESFPMHGIHCSHNHITDKGAFRLIQAASKCGHYPRLTTRLPLWLRLECNHIVNPQRVVADCNIHEFNVCLMGNGECSRPNCNHYSGVHVQLPYFFNQLSQGAPKATLMPQPTVVRPKMSHVRPPMNMQRPPMNLQRPPLSQQAEPDDMNAHELLSIYRSETPSNVPGDHEPDWRKRERRTDSLQAAMMTPAPKRQNFVVTPKAATSGMLPVPHSKAMAMKGAAAQSAPRIPKLLPAQFVPRPNMPAREALQYAGNVGADAGYISFGGEDWQASSNPYLDNVATHEETGNRISNGEIGDGDLAAGGPFGGKGNSWNGCNNKGFKSAGCKDRTEVKGHGKYDKGGCNFGGGCTWKGGAEVSGGGWKGGGGCNQDQSFKGGKGDGKSGKTGKRGQYWSGPSLISKVKKDTQLVEGDLQLGFMWEYLGNGIAPRVSRVDFNSKVSQVADVGVGLLRINGLDAAMLTEKQVTDLLKTRPISLRFGDQ